MTGGACQDHHQDRTGFFNHRSSKICLRNDFPKIADLCPSCYQIEPGKASHALLPRSGRVKIVALRRSAPRKKTNHKTEQKSPDMRPEGHAAELPARAQCHCPIE